MRNGKTTGSKETSSGPVFREAWKAQISFCGNRKADLLKRIDNDFDEINRVQIG